MNNIRCKKQKKFIAPIRVIWSFGVKEIPLPHRFYYKLVKELTFHRSQTVAVCVFFNVNAYIIPNK